MPVCLSVYLSVWNNLDFTGRTFVKFLYWGFLLKSKDDIQIWLKSDNITEDKHDNDSLITVTNFCVK